MIYGWGTKLKKWCYIGRYYCQTCDGFTNYYLMRKISYVSLFFIPVFWHTKAYFVVCQSCERGRKVDKEQALSIKGKFQDFLTEKQVVQLVNFLQVEIRDSSFSFSSVQQEELLKRALEKYHMQKFDDYVEKLMQNICLIERSIQENEG